jgi:hypothetical protein
MEKKKKKKKEKKEKKKVSLGKSKNSLGFYITLCEGCHRKECE